MEIEMVADTYYLQAELILRDCTRSITLDFTAHSQKELRAAKKKVTLIIDSLVAMRDKLDEGFEEHEKLKAEWEAAKKEKTEEWI